MQNTFKKFFENDKIFYLAPWVCLVSYLIYDGFTLFDDGALEDSLYYVIYDIFTVACMLGVTISFKKHEKNVMKALVGGILLLEASSRLTNFAYNALYDNGDTIHPAFSGIMFLLAVCLTINHFMLVSDHNAKPQTIKTNQLIILAMIIIDIIWEAYCYVIEEYSIVYSITYEIAYFTVLYVIVAVESKVDVFKLNRQQNN